MRRGPRSRGRITRTPRISRRSIHPRCSSIRPPPAPPLSCMPGSARGRCGGRRSFPPPPPSCSSSSRGETGLLVVQNLHRYALYVAIAFIFILYADAYQAFFRDGRIGVGVGSVVLLVNPTLLAAYTFGCHSWRHLVGGRLDCFSCERGVPVRLGIWRGASALNAHHMQWAWVSLFWVGFSDLYVRLLSMGLI